MTFTGSAADTTSFDVELIAIASALEHLPKGKNQIRLRTDCEFACSGETLAHAKEVQSDRDKLRQERKVVRRFFSALYKHENVKFIKVRSHGDGEDNDAVHIGAKNAAREAAKAANAPLREHFGYPPPPQAGLAQIAATL